MNNWQIGIGLLTFFVIWGPYLQSEYFDKPILSDNQMYSCLLEKYYETRANWYLPYSKCIQGYTVWSTDPFQQTHRRIDERQFFEQFKILESTFLEDVEK